MQYSQKRPAFIDGAPGISGKYAVMFGVLVLLVVFVPFNIQSNVALLQGKNLSKQHVCYFRPPNHNFGDEIGPEIVVRLLKKYFQRDIDFPTYHMHSAYPKKCLFALGSILHAAQLDDIVWGSGVNPRYIGNLTRKCQRASDKKIETYALRGKLSKDYLLDHKCKLRFSENFAFGDPGLLVGRLFPEYQVDTAPANKFCIVPHYHDSNVYDQQLKPYEEHIIMPTQPFDKVIRALTNCSLVISSSLHAIIIPEALGITARWLRLNGSDTAKKEGTFKYNDYYSSTERSLDDYATSIEEALEMGGKERLHGFDFDALESSFPYHLFG
jgi:pyruvyltransferase